MSDNNKKISESIYESVKGQQYNPSSYTCVKEFVPDFPRLEDKRSRFKADPVLAKFQWRPEPPYPCVYTPDYKKNILSP